MPDQPPLVSPFTGERFTARQLSPLLSPPYDVLGASRRAEYAERHTDNIVNLILPLGDGAERYRSAAGVLADWRARQVTARDPEPSLYVVQQEFSSPDEVFVRTGVIGAVAAEPYETGRVLPHERTHRGPKEDRLALLRATRVQSEAIFLVARDHRGHLRRRLEGVTRHEPHATADLDGVSVRLWRVFGVQAREIAHAAGKTLYIADGHHRYETAATAAAADPSAARIPALIVPVGDPGLVVRPTHRIVLGSPIDPEAARIRLGERFDIDAREVELAPEGLLNELDGEGVRCIVLVGGGVWVCSAPGDGRLPLAFVEEWAVDPLRELAGGEVTYSPDVREVFEGLGAAAAGVLVAPTPLEAVFATADNRGIMPPKSTYFEPKVPSGLVWMPLD